MHPVHDPVARTENDGVGHVDVERELQVLDDAPHRRCHRAYVAVEPVVLVDLPERVEIDLFGLEVPAELD